MAERKPPEELVNAPADVTNIPRENENEQGDEGREESEIWQSETINGVPDTLSQYPPQGRAIRIKESARDTPPLPRIREGTRTENDTGEEGIMANKLPTTNALGENSSAQASTASPEQPEYPPPGPPVLVSDIGIGIERKRREAREVWEREYGSGERREA